MVASGRRAAEAGRLGCQPVVSGDAGGPACSAARLAQQRRGLRPPLPPTPSVSTSFDGSLLASPLHLPPRQFLTRPSPSPPPAPLPAVTIASQSRAAMGARGGRCPGTYELGRRTPRAARDARRGDASSYRENGYLMWPQQMAARPTTLHACARARAAHTCTRAPLHGVPTHQGARSCLGVFAWVRTPCWRLALPACRMRVRRHRQ